MFFGSVGLFSVVSFGGWTTLASSGQKQGNSGAKAGDGQGQAWWG
jgi:hypothetical protein